VFKPNSQVVGSGTTCNRKKNACQEKTGARQPQKNLFGKKDRLLEKGKKWDVSIAKVQETRGGYERKATIGLDKLGEKFLGLWVQTGGVDGRVKK